MSVNTTHQCPLSFMADFLKKTCRILEYNNVICMSNRTFTFTQQTSREC